MSWVVWEKEFQQNPTTCCSKGSQKLYFLELSLDTPPYPVYGKHITISTTQKTSVTIETIKILGQYYQELKLSADQADFFLPAICSKMISDRQLKNIWSMLHLKQLFNNIFIPPYGTPLSNEIFIPYNKSFLTVLLSNRYLNSWVTLNML